MMASPHWKRVCSAACAGLLLAATVVAQSPPAPATPAPPPAPRFTSDQAKQEALGQVRLLADQIFEMKDPAARVRGLAAIGRATCRYDKDFALETFLRAYPIIQRGSEREQFTLRRALIPQIARCDSALAFRLNAAKAEEGSSAKEPTGNGDVNSDMDSARITLAEDPAQAVRFARRVADATLSDQQLQSFVMALIEIRQKDAAAADSIFLALVAKVRSELRPEANRVLLLANYLFSGPRFPGMPPGPGGVMFVSVGGLPSYHVGEERGGMNPQLVRPFLESVLDIFSRPVSDPRLQQFDYVALRQLLPHAQRHAPELVPLFTLRQQALDPSVPDRFRDPATYGVLTPGAPTNTPTMEQRIAGETTPAKRDQWRIYALHAAWTRSEITEARKAASELEVPELRDRVAALLLFFDARKALESDRIEEAAEMVRKMPPSVKRALLALGLAMATRQASADEARAWWRMAGKDGEDADPRIRGNLLLGVAHTGLAMERNTALALLDQAVRAFNAAYKPADVAAQQAVTESSPWGSYVPPVNPPTERGSIKFSGAFYEEVVPGDFPLQFTLTLKGLTVWDFTPALLGGVGADAPQAQAIVAKLEEETRRSAALASLATAYLENATAKPASAATKTQQPQGH